MVSPQQVADHIYANFDSYSGPKGLKDEIVSAARSLSPGTSELALTEAVTGDNLPAFISEILGKEQKDRLAGLFCPYEAQPDNDLIIGFAYPRPSDTELMGKVRRVATQVRSALAEMRSLSATEFEVFCTRILDLLDAEDTLTTKASGDEGIDFMGWLRLPETLVPMGEIAPFRRDFRILVIGQAKKYDIDHPVGVAPIRELVGTIAAFHHDQLAPWPSKFPLATVKLITPIVPLMMTTGRVTEGAKELARKCGVAVREGPELALFICLEGVGMVDVAQNGTARSQFDPSRFRDWLKNQGGATTSGADLTVTS